jgi:hypothetical protein
LSKNAKDPITLSMQDSLREARSALASAPEMGWSERQIADLRREVDFFSALVQRAPNVPRPPDYVLERMRTSIKRWAEAVEWGRASAALNTEQAALRNEFEVSLQRLQSAIEQFAPDAPTASEDI